MGLPFASYASGVLIEAHLAVGVSDGSWEAALIVEVDEPEVDDELKAVFASACDFPRFCFEGDRLRARCVIASCVLGAGAIAQ